MTSTISAVILAGGKGMRMGGVDKGLQYWQKKPLFMHVYQRLLPQVQSISINANRNQDIYAETGLKVFSDKLSNFQGPLAGILAGLEQADSDFVLFVPCDCPCMPSNLLEKLSEALWQNNALIAYAHDGEREHPTFCLISTSLIQQLANYLASGERKMLYFMQQNEAVVVDFSEQKESFHNFNSLVDLQG